MAADETLDRVARRLQDGEAIARIQAYAHGVARIVLLEQRRRRMRERRAVAGAVRQMSVPPAAVEEARFECLVRGLQSLSPEDRELILGYYESAERPHREGRKALAARLGIAGTALRARACRLRVRLEAHLRSRDPGPDLAFGA